MRRNILDFTDKAMQRGAEPQEMAGAVLFLCSDAASYLTGQILTIDGAQTIRGLLPPRY